jgi:hypothetical protein
VKFVFSVCVSCLYPCRAVPFICLCVLILLFYPALPPRYYQRLVSVNRRLTRLETATSTRLISELKRPAAVARE